MTIYQELQLITGNSWLIALAMVIGWIVAVNLILYVLTKD